MVGGPIQVRNLVWSHVSLSLCTVFNLTSRFCPLFWQNWGAQYPQFRVLHEKLNSVQMIYLKKRKEKFNVTTIWEGRHQLADGGQPILQAPLLIMKCNNLGSALIVMKPQLGL
jgi:hypothetical protein